jgi:hypothetical protein
MPMVALIHNKCIFFTEKVGTIKLVILHLTSLSQRGCSLFFMNKEWQCEMTDINFVSMYEDAILKFLN